MQRLVAPGVVEQVGDGAACGHGLRPYPGTSTDSCAIEILADWGALGMPFWLGKEVTSFLLGRLHMLYVGAIGALEGAVTVI